MRQLIAYTSNLHLCVYRVWRSRRRRRRRCGRRFRTAGFFFLFLSGDLPSLAICIIFSVHRPEHCFVTETTPPQLLSSVNTCAVCSVWRRITRPPRHPPPPPPPREFAEGVFETVPIVFTVHKSLLGRGLSTRTSCRSLIVRVLHERTSC